MARKLPAMAVAVLSLTMTGGALAGSYASRTLAVGASGSDVTKLQRYLDRAGYDTSADGQFGTATRRSVVRFERAEERRANDHASHSEQRIVRARAAAAVPEPSAPAGEEAYLDSDGMAVGPASAPGEVREIIEAGNRIAPK